MTISLRTRQDVVIVDPERFLAAAREAFRSVHRLQDYGCFLPEDPYALPHRDGGA
jgi:hypothetical protein